MSARQRGFARKRGSLWLAVWREDGRERSRGRFATKTEALDYANRKAQEAVAREDALRFGDRLPQPVSPIVDVSGLVEAFLARHRVDEATTRKLRSQLKHATAAFGDRRPETLQPIELDVWRSQLPARSAHYVFRAFRQVLEYAVGMGLIEANPTSRIRNVRATVDRRQIHPFETWAEVEAISEEIDPRYRQIPTVLVGTGLRPEELFALERRDLDLETGVISVERVYSQGVLKDCRKPRGRGAVFRCVAGLWRRYGASLRGSTHSWCSRPREAATSTRRSCATATGRPRSGPPMWATAVSTTAATRSRAFRSPRG
jgi:integrase